MSAKVFQRYIWIVDTIYRKGKITLKELNNEWLRAGITDGSPIPEKTFHNQRIAIEETFDINILCDKSTNSYYIQNADDLAHGGVRTWLLNTFAVNNLINESHKIKHRIQFEQIPSGQQYLADIIEAMRENLKVQICYHSYWSPEATFDLEPYFVKVFKQRWYVIGKSDEVRIYALDRIQELSKTEKPFNMPTDIDPETFFRDCYGVIIADNLKAQTIRIKVNINQAKYLRSLPLHISQKEIETTEDYSVFEYFIKPTFDFIQELLTHCSWAEVIHPQKFRDEMKRITAEMANLYK